MELVTEECEMLTAIFPKGDSRRTWLLIFMGAQAVESLR